MLNLRGLIGLLMACVLSLLAACGGGNDIPSLISIQITPPAVTKAVGLRQQFSAIGTYSSGPNQDITTAVAWNSSDASKASIDAGGLATALGVGAATITASLGGVSSNAAVLTVSDAALVSIQITPPAVSKAVGLTQQYSAIGTYTAGPNQDITAAVAWSSSDETKVSVDAAGLASAAGAGPTTITASLNGIVSNSATFNATAAVLVSMQITPAASSKAVGLTQQYIATGIYSDASTPDITASVAWSSSDSDKATISASGLATAVAAGSANITASLDGINANSAVFTVTPAALVSIQITPASASKAVGLTQQYTATGTYSDASTPDITASVSWNSSDTAKATIGAGGLATAVAAGSTDLSASLDGVTSNTAGLTVTATATATATGALAAARYLHTATLLANGKVLVSGGDGNAGRLASSELYDPATGQWTATGALTTERSEHTATLLADGKVLVSAGYGANPLASSELYDPATGQWTASGALAAGRSIHTATLLANGKVLVSGGYGNGLLLSSELYDPATGQWTASGALTAGRYFHTATLLAGGKVLVSGGSGNAGLLASSELYDPATGQWTATGALAAARRLHTATLLADGKVFVSGGQNNAGRLASSELYDPAIGQWTATGALTTARSEHTATLLADGKVLVSGGYGAGYLSSSELYY